MEFTIETDHELALVRVSIHGSVDGEQLVNINEDVSSIKAAKYQLWIFNTDEAISFSPEQIHRIAIQDWDLSRNSNIEKVALVGSLQAIRSLNNYYKNFSDLWVGRPNRFQSEMFQDLSEATAWLGIPD